MHRRTLMIIHFLILLGFIGAAILYANLVTAGLITIGIIKIATGGK